MKCFTCISRRMLEQLRLFCSKVWLAVCCPLFNVLVSGNAELATFTCFLDLSANQTLLPKLNTVNIVF